MSDKPLDVYVLYATDTEQRFIKVADDGCLAIFDNEASAKRAKRRNPGTDYKQVNYYSQKQVDQMQAANRDLQHWFDDARATAERLESDNEVLRARVAELGNKCQAQQEVIMNLQALNRADDLRKQAEALEAEADNWSEGSDGPYIGREILNSAQRLRQQADALERQSVERGE